jgi:hypothetical protein
LPGSPAAFHAPDIFTVDEPRFKVLTAAELQLGKDVNVDHVQIVPLVFNVPFLKVIVPLNDLLAFKLTIAPAPFIDIAVLVPDDVAWKLIFAPAVIPKVLLIVANALNVMLAAAFTLKVDVVILFVKFSVAACETVIAPVVHAAVFDHVPVPAKNTGPKFFPPELMVLVPVPKKYTFIDVVHVP